MPEIPTQPARVMKLLVLASMAIVLLVGCQILGEQKKGGTLTLRLKRAVPLVNPLVDDPETQKVTSLLFIGLTKPDQNFRPRPALAEKWTTSGDGQVIVFTLRDNLKWHDGKKLTADDVVFTYRWMMRGEPATVAQSDVQQVLEDVTAFDDRTVRFALRRAYSPFLADTAFPILPKHLLENERDLQKVSMSTGNGPFVLRQNGADGTIDLQRFESSAEAPLLGAVRFVVEPEDALALDMMSKGGLDIAEVEVPLLLEQSPKGFVADKYQELGFNYVGFNLREGRLFSDKNLRYAWEWAVDKERLVGEATGWNGAPVWGHLPVSSWAFNNADRLMAGKDTERAKGFLTASGWADTDGDGLVEKDGRTLAFDLFVRLDDAARVKAAYLLSDELRDIGMDARVKPVDFNSDLTLRRQPPFDFDAMIMGWKLGTDPDDYYLFASGQIPTSERPFLSNFVGFSSKEFDDLSKKARTLTALNERQEIYAKTQALIAEQQPYYFLWAEQTGVIASPRVKGPLYLASPLYLADIEKVWVEGNPGK